MTTPATFRIAERPVEFPCWLFGALTQGGLKGPCGWYRGADHWYVGVWTTHWSSSDAKPLHDPREAEGSPSLSKSLKEGSRSMTAEEAKATAAFVDSHFKPSPDWEKLAQELADKLEEVVYSTGIEKSLRTECDALLSRFDQATKGAQRANSAPPTERGGEEGRE